jgi:hypothetical protein
MKYSRAREGFIGPRQETHPRNYAPPPIRPLRAALQPPTPPPPLLLSCALTSGELCHCAIASECSNAPSSRRCCARTSNDRHRAQRRYD